MLPCVLLALVSGVAPATAISRGLIHAKNDAYVEKWPKRGWETFLERPLPYTEFLPRILPYIPFRHAPFNPSTGRGNLGYLYELPSDAAHLLLELGGGQGGAVFDRDCTMWSVAQHYRL